MPTPPMQHRRTAAAIDLQGVRFSSACEEVARLHGRLKLLNGVDWKGATGADVQAAIFDLSCVRFRLARELPDLLPTLMNGSHPPLADGASFDEQFRQPPAQWYGIAPDTPSMDLVSAGLLDVLPTLGRVQCEMDYLLRDRRELEDGFIASMCDLWAKQQRRSRKKADHPIPTGKDHPHYREQDDKNRKGAAALTADMLRATQTIVDLCGLSDDWRGMH